METILTFRWCLLFLLLHIYTSTRANETIVKKDRKNKHKQTDQHTAPDLIFLIDVLLLFIFIGDLKSFLEKDTD